MVLSRQQTYEERMPMLTLGIYGSPRKTGNTDAMLDAFLDGAATSGSEIHRLYARDVTVRGCLECGHCDKEGQCIIVDDDMAKIYPMLQEAPRIVVASPIFFYGLTGQLKLIIDRTQAVYMKHELTRKKTGHLAVETHRQGFFLSAGATRGKRLFECAILAMKYFYDALNIPYAGELCFWEIEQKGAIKDHPTALEECRRAGQGFVKPASAV
jgi:multimeric flavodoxin WrbA